MRSTLFTVVITLGLQLLSMGCQPPPSSSIDSSLSGEVSFPGAFGDRPIEQARVWLEYKNNVYDETRTDLNGRFTLSNLPNGEFDIVVEKGEQYAVYRASERLGKMFDPNDSIQFPRGQLFLRIEIQARPTTLTGKAVSAENGDPIKGARIATYPSSIEVQTDENGQFVLESDKLELVRTSVSASHPDFQSAQVFLEKAALRMAGINEVPIIEMHEVQLGAGIEAGEVEYGADESEGRVIPGPGSN
jgi:hypothetical protein